jgi:hypothetical protein
MTDDSAGPAGRARIRPHQNQLRGPLQAVGEPFDRGGHSAREDCFSSRAEPSKVSSQIMI